MKQYKLCLLSFDGDTQIERPIFDSAEDAWEYENDLGSKWFFYPFHFLITTSHSTIIDTCYGLEAAKGKRLKTVQEAFEFCSNLSKLMDEPVTIEVFTRFVNTYLADGAPYLLQVLAEEKETKEEYARN